jgi:hypothetical protein
LRLASPSPSTCRAQDQDVRGLDVAVLDAFLVSEVKPGADLPHDAELVFEGQLRLPGDDPAELALEQLHHDEEPPAVLAHVVDDDDVMTM